MSGYIDRGEMRLSTARNFVHSAALIGAMVLLLATVGGLFGGPLLVAIVLVIGIPLLVVSPDVAARMMLRMSGAQRLSHENAPGLVDLVARLSQRAKLPTVPRVYRVPGPVVTAFTVGTRRDAAIGLSDGLARTLNPRELTAVLAHEISHVKKNDIWVMGLADLMGRATRFMSLTGQILLFLNLPLMLLGRLTMPWTAILLLIFAPTVSAMLQLALSRAREYEADAGAARLTGDPRGLASALAKLERVNAGLFERVFFPGGRGRGPVLLRTHPLTEDRIERLRQLEGGSVPPAAVA